MVTSICDETFNKTVIKLLFLFEAVKCSMKVFTREQGREQLQRGSSVNMYYPRGEGGGGGL